MNFAVALQDARKVAAVAVLFKRFKGQSTLVSRAIAFILTDHKCKILFISKKMHCSNGRCPWVTFTSKSVLKSMVIRFL